MLNSSDYLIYGATKSGQIGPQMPTTPIMEGMVYFHNYLMFFMVSIAVFVFFLIGSTLHQFDEKNSNLKPIRFTHSSTLEIVWTIVPAIILVLIAVPSFTLLYSLDEVVDPSVTIKIIGHQWYWTYEYSDYVEQTKWGTLCFDSYMVPTSRLTSLGLRLLETDYKLLLPWRTHIRLLVTSSDVIHSWAVPSFGLKVDATPGRLTQASLYAKQKGIFYGQCSEICGVNHAFMPIGVAVLSKKLYLNWVAFKLYVLVGSFYKAYTLGHDHFNNSRATIADTIKSY